jgi:hypothetical protein
VSIADETGNITSLTIPDVNFTVGQRLHLSAGSSGLGACSIPPAT